MATTATESDTGESGEPAMPLQVIGPEVQTLSHTTKRTPVQAPAGAAPQGARTDSAITIPNVAPSEPVFVGSAIAYPTVIRAEVVAPPPQAQQRRRIAGWTPPAASLASPTVAVQPSSAVSTDAAPRIDGENAGVEGNAAAPAETLRVTAILDEPRARQVQGRDGGRREGGSRGEPRQSNRIEVREDGRSTTSSVPRNSVAPSSTQPEQLARPLAQPSTRVPDETSVVGYLPLPEAMVQQPPVPGGDSAIFHVGRSTQLRHDPGARVSRTRRRGGHDPADVARNEATGGVTGIGADRDPVLVDRRVPAPAAQQSFRSAGQASEAQPTGDLALLLRGMEDIQVRQTERLLSAMRPVSSTPIAAGLAAGMERVAVFVDVANLLYAARYLNRWIDFGKLLERLLAGRRLVRAQAYSPTDPDPAAEQAFFAPVKGQGYRVTTKHYRTFSSGAKKADLDLDIAMDIVRLVDARAVDCVILASGDGDFLPVLEYCSDHGVKVEVAAFNESTHDELREVCDRFTNLSMMDVVPARR